MGEQKNDFTQEILGIIVGVLLAAILYMDYTRLGIEISLLVLIAE
jgi:hypothetical protein